MVGAVPRRQADAGRSLGQIVLIREAMMNTEVSATSRRKEKAATSLRSPCPDGYARVSLLVLPKNLRRNGFPPNCLVTAEPRLSHVGLSALGKWRPMRMDVGRRLQIETVDGAVVQEHCFRWREALWSAHDES